MSHLAWIEARGIVVTITMYNLLMLFYLVLYLINKRIFCIHAMKEYWGGIGGTTSLIRILITDELSGKLQAVASVSLGKEPHGLV